MFFSRLQFDECPHYFWILGHVLLGTFSIWLILRQKPLADWLFFTLIFVITGTMRLPVFLFNYQIDVDEAQALAQGITLAVDPVIYQSVDPTTGGPLTSYFLAACSHLFPLNFQFAHILSWVFTLTALLMVYKAVQYLQLGSTVQLAMLPFIALISFSQTSDFVHFYSEALSISVLSISVWFLARWTYYKNFTIVELITFGLLMGLLPLCKIQAVPMAFVVGVFACIQIFLFQKSKFVGYSSLIIGSILVVWAVWSIFLWANDVFDDFITFYIKANFQYKDNLASATRRSHLVNFFRLPYVIARGNSNFEWVLLPLCLLFLNFAYICFLTKKISHFFKMDSYFWIMLIAYLIMTDIAVTRTGSFYAHYYHFLFLPFLLLISWSLKHIPTRSRWLILSAQLGFLYLLLQNIVYDRPTNEYPFYGRNQDISDAKIVSSIRKYGKEDDYLAVWGWSCNYFVEAKMPQGVNENHTTRSAMKQPLQPIYLERYLKDLKRTKPPIFVDAVGEKAIWINDRSKYGHECFSTLAKYIAENYTLKEELEDVRIYVRNKKGNLAQ
ncbi:hypothetical protein [Runella aurantiaca]|uniref:Glycosyltransferase RgtA/B/C/D-like domain-containing protein n=1 Tax=Runella aurantiaca TaxID=2282308 RepID=A0A369IC81_9BACT|nr:hypothetical protein [Runella aurantiaca]RDB04824.1 hypothetical protein DVG78_16355 [Runella aurantiaca]